MTTSPLNFIILKGNKCLPFQIIHVESLVSLSPSFLSEYAVGPLMAPTHMKWHAKAPDGRMTREEAERVVKQYLRYKKIKVRICIDKILKMLVGMGLIFRLEDGTYMFPSHLPLKKLSEVWKKEADKQVYMLAVVISAPVQHPFSAHLHSLSSSVRHVSSSTSSHFCGEMA